MSNLTHSNCPACGSSDLKNLFLCKDHFLSQEEFPIVECSECSLIITQNYPDQNSAGKYYESEDYISHSDSNKGIVFKLYHWAREMMLKRKLKIIERHSTLGGSLLDIGSGTGYFLNQAKSFGWQVKGIEQDPKARELTQKNFQIDALPGEELFNLEDNQFDAITMWHVLEHVHQLNEYLEKINKVLKNDGAFVVAVPNPSSKDASVYKEYWAAWDVPRHLWHFTPSSMEKLVKKHGFKLIKKKIMPFDPFYICIMSEKYKGGSKLKGFINGFVAYLSSLFNKEKCSSLIYIMKKA